MHSVSAGMTGTFQGPGGLVAVPYPDYLRRAVENAVESWRAFCALPREAKGKFAYSEDATGGTGFEFKEEPGAKRDLKENFHVTLGSLPQFKQTARRTVSQYAGRFILDAEDLVRFSETLVLGFGRMLEEAYGLEGLEKEVFETRDRWVLRYLHYFGGRTAGEEIAVPHADKSGFTLHLYESHAGLQYLSQNGGAWEEMPVPEGQTVIIPGMQLQLRSRNELKALCHRVIATPESAAEGRWSMVCFVPFSRTPVYNKSGKGRLQEFEAGFNYTMPFSEFERLFA